MSQLVRSGDRFQSPNRRDFLQASAAGVAAAGALGMNDLCTLQAEEWKRGGRAMILLWMQGGPSQMETFDPKPGTNNGGPTTAIETSVPGIQVAQDWPLTAQVMKEIAILRSMTNKEGEHQRATYQMHTGYVPTGTLRHPSVGAALAKELADKGCDLPPVVAVGPTVGSGFLGVDYEPFVVQAPGELPGNVIGRVKGPRFNRRLDLLGRLEDEFAGKGAEAQVAEHKQLYDKTRRMVLSDNVKAFEFTDESDETKKLYGDSAFGKGCLLARRLVEAGVSFIEVRSNGWDTHQENFKQVTKLAGPVDRGMSGLITDLRQRGLLDRTLVVWMGEFGRTPKINPRTGRDHFPRAFNALMAGGGIRGGQVYGASSNDGQQVKDNPVTVQDLFATMCRSLQVDPATENFSPIGRPLKIVDGGKAIDALFA
ncbi:MAG TPA: DUF1501 domain-containing protein [Planctomycetaceae bacterium]|nr:DUF1501 domain-containing protein [Planctomycetaceae bacterium]